LGISGLGQLEWGAEENIFVTESKPG